MVVLLAYFLAGYFLAGTRAEPCKFEAVGKSECCVIPFKFNNRIYTECTADVTSKDWKQQWKDPWCPLKYQADKKIKCVRKEGTCGGIRTQSAGVISSSNFPNRYENNISCVWTIHVESANRITLNFTDFDLEPGSNETYVRAHDGDNVTDHVIATFSGNQTPSSIQSSGNKLLVIFHSFKGANRKGFRAYYDSGSCDVRSYGGNGGGACCVFPFIYKGQQYHRCTTEDSRTSGFYGEPWCAVTDNYDRDEKRGLCVTERVSCRKNEFTCKNNHWWKQCIDKKYYCDGTVQCADGSDEHNCSERLNPYMCEVYYTVKFPNGGVFFKLERSCDSSDRCGNSSATADISKSCRFSSWSRCRNGLCVPRYWLCDGKDDCGDRSDELLDQCQDQPEDNKECVWMTHCSPKGWEHSLRAEQPREISSMAFCHFPKLTVVPQYLPHSITNLLLNKKEIQTIKPGSLARYQKLRELDLTYNKLRILRSGTFEGLSSVTVLKLWGNPVQHIESHAFNGLKRLKKLNLSAFEEGGLRTIESGAFDGMDSLTHLYLAGNKHLTTLPLDIFDKVPLLYLDADKFEFCCIAKLSGANCSAPKDLFSSCGDLMANLTLRYCIWILGCIALFGNVVVLIWRLRTRRDSKVHSMLLFNLAFSDLLMGIYLVGIGSADIYYRGKYSVYNDEWKQSPLCQLSGFISSLSCEASVLILTTMTTDRYVTIVHPFRNIGLKVRGTYITLSVIWLVSFTLAVVPLAGIDYFADFYGRSSVCLPLHLTAEKPTGWEYSVFVYLVLNFSSFIVIFFLYLIMFFKIKSTRQRTGSHSSTASIGKRMVFIVLTDFFCWVPIILIGIASLLGMKAQPDVYAWIAVFVLPLNSALNPVLYTISTANFRRKLRSSVRKASQKGTMTSSFLENSTKKQSSFRMTVTADFPEKVPLSNGSAKDDV